MYLYETHLHSCGCSACGISTATEMVDAAAACGYAGVVFTNHFYHGNTCIPRNLPWPDFVDAYRQDYEIAKDYGIKKQVEVLFGIEEVYLPGKEVLIYGLSPDILAAEPTFPNFNLKQIAAFVREHNGFLSCAHPFRVRNYIPDPDTIPSLLDFDAIEVYNYFNSAEENARADKLAQDNELLRTSGGDIHQAKDFGHAGLAFSAPLHSEAELAVALRTGDYSLVIDGELSKA